MKTTEEIVTELFRRRFPDKDLDFKKKCDYFYEWVQRFESGDPERFMDEDTLHHWKVMQADFVYI